MQAESSEALLDPNFFFSPRPNYAQNPPENRYGKRRDVACYVSTAISMLAAADFVFLHGEASYNLLYQRIRITLMLGDFGGEARDLCFRQTLIQ